MKLFGHLRRHCDEAGNLIELFPSPARAITRDSLPAGFGSDRGRRLIVSLEAGDLIVIRPAGTRRRYSAPAVNVLAWMLRTAANSATLERARNRKAAKARRLASQRQDRAERRLFNCSKRTDNRPVGWR